MMTMNEIKKAIVKAFEEEYGFAPAMNKIIPMESSGCGNKLDWMAFTVGRIGYTFSKKDGLDRNDAYDREI